MDSEIPWLGSGAEPADCPIWRTVERLSVDREWPGTAQTVTPGHLILLALAVLPEMPNLIHEAGCGQRPRSGKPANAYLSCMRA